jgi:hypothetical protein
MPKYIVTMCRVSFGHHDIEVEADCPDDAEDKAHNDAGNHLYKERSCRYEIDHVAEVPE